MSTLPAGAPVWHLYVPKLFTVLRRGYGLEDWRRDLAAGITVAPVALPLAMALRAGTRVILSGLREQPRAILEQMGVRADGRELRLAAGIPEALTLAGAAP